MTQKCLEGILSIHVISDDTEVMVLLLHFYTLKKLSCNLLVYGTIHSRASADIKATGKEYTAYVRLSGCNTVTSVGDRERQCTQKAGYQLNRPAFLDAELPIVMNEAT